MERHHWLQRGGSGICGFLRDEKSVLLLSTSLLSGPQEESRRALVPNADDRVFPGAPLFLALTEKYSVD